MRTTLIAFLGTVTFAHVCSQFAAAQVPPPSPAPAPRAWASSAPPPSYIGVMVQEVDGDRARALKLKEEAGVEITHITPDSPAEKAGLKPGDAIVSYNGQRVEGMEHFSRLVHETPAGRDVKLEVVRGGMPQTIVVKVAARRSAPMAGVGPMTRPVPGNEQFQMPDIPRSFMSWRSSALGVECEMLEGQLAQYFGVENGVLVRSVSKGSAAEKAGIKAGDVITRVDDQRITSPADISARIRSMRGKQVSMMVVREHKEMMLTVAIDDDDHAQGMWQWEGTPAANPTPARMIRSVQ